MYGVVGSIAFQVLVKVPIQVLRTNPDGSIVNRQSSIVGRRSSVVGR